MTKKQCIKAVAFLLLLAMVFIEANSVFGTVADYKEHAEMMFEGFYSQEKNTDDVIIIGNSHVYNFWESPYMWDQYDITGMPISTAAMPADVYKNLAIEAMKTQSPKLIIFEVSSFSSADKKNERVYMDIENMKLSKNYFDLINAHCDSDKIYGFDRIPYYFPIVKFHTRWKYLTKEDFIQCDPSYLNGYYEKDFLTKTSKEVDYVYNDKRRKIGKQMEKNLLDLLDWCSQQEGVQFEFIAAPGYWINHYRPEMINYVCDLIEEKGFNVENFLETEKFETFNFTSNVDFWDGKANHTNVNGAFKFCQVYGQHLVEKYGLEDHRGDPKYASWDELSGKYFKKINKYFTHQDELIGDYGLETVQ